MTGSIAVVYADAALFGMDRTLIDSIGAVETLSAKVAAEIGADLEASSTCLSRCSSLTPNSAASTPYDSSEASTSVSSRAESFSAPESLTFAARLTHILTESSFQGSAIADDDEEADALPLEDRQTMKLMEAWQPEVTGTDRSVRIFPGVNAMFDSIPEGRYAIATSNTKTYAHGCLARVGIAPPAVTITTDDPRLKAEKPSPDPLLLAAECLGYDARRCVVFEDSPTGIRAGLAAGAIVIAVRTGRSQEDVATCGAHFVVDDMERMQCRAVERDGEECLEFSIELQDGEDELLCF